MLWYIAALVAILAGSRAQQEIDKKQQEPPAPAAPAAAAPPPPAPGQQPAPLSYYGDFQGQLPLQYDVRFLEPQEQLQQIPNLGFEKQIFPRVQPQVLFYPGGAPPGQQFLLQPGAPPGNFLYPQPQPGPEIVLRDSPPPRPLFVAGYPKPAHVPPIEKDAEEIPTDPAKIPKFPTNNKKPEKLETFNEETDEQGYPGTAPKNPNFLPKKSTSGLKPGQRFFVLNGQNLFPSYPFHTFNGIPQGIEPLKYEQAPIQPQEFLPQQQQQQQQHQQQQISSFEQQQFPFFFGNPAHNELNGHFGGGQNIVALNQPQDFAPQDVGYPGFPFAPGRGELALQKLETRQNDKNSDVGALNENFDSQYLVGGSISKVPLRYYQYETTRVGPENDDSVVIDANVQDEKKQTSSKLKASPSPNTPTEPSISQAQPGAIALAGPGGVAAAAPRGTALVGDGGLAVSSPQATAVAGPTRDDQPPQKKKNKNNSNNNRKP